MDVGAVAVAARAEQDWRRRPRRRRGPEAGRTGAQTDNARLDLELCVMRNKKKAGCLGSSYFEQSPPVHTFMNGDVEFFFFFVSPGEPVM